MFSDVSYLYLNAFVIIRCTLNVFALFLKQNSALLTSPYWFEYDLLRQMPPGVFLAQDVFPYSQYV